MRITLDNVLAAYKKLNITPLCRGFLIVKNRSRITCACPQTVLYYANLNWQLPRDTCSETLIAGDVAGWARWKYGPPYASRFREFYDWPDRAVRLDVMSARELEGASDGLRVRFGLEQAFGVIKEMETL